jgi:predicted GH43/DUF377 family glycosyl hydrolase
LPDGVYEYGEIGIGTCLAAPAALTFLDEGRVLAVSNSNAWGDFTGGSLLTLDLETVDWAERRNVIAPPGGGDGVAAAAVALASMTGPFAHAEARDLLVVTNRLSEDSRTREEPDSVWFVDVSDPRAPAYAEIGPKGPWLDVGWDPVAAHYTAGTDIAWVLNRTAHTVSMLDLSADPVESVPPGGPARLDPNAFVDGDGTGSRADFVTLAVTEDEDVDPTAHTWSFEWAIGVVRLWAPDPDGAFRVTGNGDGVWARSNVTADLDLEDADGEVLAVGSPHYLTDITEDGDPLARVVFADQGVLRGAYAPVGLESWVFESEPLLEPSASGWDTTVDAPAMLLSGGTWYLFYAGGDGAPSAIGLATSTDGVTFSRADDAPVLAIEGSVVTDPFVLWDEQIGRWRMYYTVDGAWVGEAYSEDLTDWVPAGTWAPAGGASAPAVSWYNGAFHLFYVGGDGLLAQARSVDGSSWEVVGLVPGLDADATLSGGVALQVETEEAWRLEDQGGTVLRATLTPGDTLDSGEGWETRVAVGHLLEPGDADAASIQLDSVVGESVWFTRVDEAGLSSIGVGTRVGDGVTLDPEPVLEPGAGGAHDADGVASAVVADFGGEYVMYYAASAGDVTTIGRATSVDGVDWVADAAPVLVAGDDWESVAMEPSSVQVLDDGTLRLWYSAYDGSRYRVGLAESADGVSFTRVPGLLYDWVFDAGAPGEWYDSGVRDAFVVRDGDIDRMWFAGYSGESWQIGYAERTGDDAEWTPAADQEGSERPVLAAALGGFGFDGVVRPVVLAEDGWAVWYTGLDEGGEDEQGVQGRVGRAVGDEPDRLHRDLQMPTTADAWSFTTVPAREGENLTLDVKVDGNSLMGLGCSAIAEDTDRGFLYIGCKLASYVYVLDIRDDSTDSFDDLNYLDIEAVLLVETSTGADSGLRALLVDRDRGWLWGLSDESEGVYAVDLSGLEDDADSEIIREAVVAILPLPRGLERDEGMDSEESVGPGQLAMHPDGRHLFITNFNDNSVSVYDLALGPAGTLVAERDAIGEEPYAIAISPDGTLAAVGNYAGDVDGAAVSSNIAILDADPESPTFLQVKTWLVNK